RVTTKLSIRFHPRSSAVQIFPPFRDRSDRSGYPDAFMFRRLDRLVVRVPNLPSAIAYYRDVLGLQLLREEKRVASLRFADQDSGEVILHCDPDLPAEAVYLLVDDVRD